MASENKGLATDYLGKKVRLKRDVDRYPNFVAKAGSTGVINWWSDDDASVKLDEPLAGAEHWDNCILWAALNGECMWDDVEVAL